MYYEEYAPDARLRPFIRSYFYINVKFGNFHSPADGCPSLIINLGEPFLLQFDAWIGRISPSPAVTAIKHTSLGNANILQVAARFLMR